MTDDDNPIAPHDGPDWSRLAHEIAAGGSAYARELADGTPVGAERATLVSALTAALHRPDPAPPTEAEVERALAGILGRRGAVAIRASAIRRAAGYAWRPLWLAAAGVLVVAGGVLVWQRTTAGDLASRAVTSAAATRSLATRVGQVDSLRLADGSRIVLAPASSVEMREWGPAGAREVTLRGEAFFDVVHDEARPFIVTTTRGTLRDVGTTFVVRTDAPSGMEVSVRSGQVAIATHGAPAGDEQLVSAGERGVVPARGAPHVERDTGGDADITFLRGRLVLRDAAVARVADEMHRWYGLDFRVTDSALLRRRVTASFDRETGPEAAQIVAAAMGGTARIVGDTVWITGAPTPTRSR